VERSQAESAWVPKVVMGALASGIGAFLTALFAVIRGM
jgi:hypothetical protein